MTYTIRRVLLFSALAGLTIGCRDARSSTEAPKGVPEIVLRGEEAMRVRLGGQIQRMLLAGQYDSLDALAESLRRADARWPNGTWKLRTFYNKGFDLSNASDADWQVHLG